MKKKWMVLLLAAAMTAGLAACGGGETETADSGDAQTEEASDGEEAVGGGELVIYSPNSEGLINATIPLFEEKYGVDVELIQAGTGELVKRIQSGWKCADREYGSDWRY